jgi:hypothetical protein
MRWLVLALLVGCSHPAPSPAPAPIVNSAPVHEPANPVVVDYKVRGYFYASAPIDEGLGGHAPSQNAPMLNASGTPERLFAHVYLDEGKTLDKGFDAIRVVIVNGSKQPVKFEASDSRLYVVQEALGPDGKWAAIEYLPSSWCGNSYHTMTLPAGAHWEFLAPRYGGPYSTKLRVKVALGNGDDGVLPGSGPQVFYSNEFAGGINLAQFTKEQGHTATNIMDPYDN